MSQRFIRRTSASALALPLLLGFALLNVGCGGGDDTHRALTPEDQKNIDDELKATEESKKSTEKKVKPSA